MALRKPKVVVTRKLPDPVETRMRELFDTELNLSDEPMSTEALIDAVGESLGPELVHRHIVLRPEEGRARARFFAAGAVLAEQALPGGSVDLEVSMPRQAFEDLCRNEGLAADGQGCANAVDAGGAGAAELAPSAAKTCAHPEPFLKSRGPASLAS